MIVERPSTFETLLRTSNSMGMYFLLCSQRSVAFPSGRMQCPPNAMSLAWDRLSGVLHTCL